MDSRTLRRKIVAGFAWQSASRLVIQVFSWITTVLVARILTPEDYGVVAIQGIFTVTVGMVVDMGVSRGLIQKQSVSEHELDSLFYFSLLLGVIAYGLYYLVAPFIASFYDIPQLSMVLRVAGLTFILGSLKSVPVAITMRNMDFRYRSLVEMGGAFVHAGSLLVLAVLGFGLWALVLSHLLNYLVTTIAYAPILGRFPRLRLRIGEIRDVLAFGVKIMMTRVMYSAYMKADILFLGRFGGERLTGYYSMAMQLAAIPLDKIGTIFNEVAFPAISRVQHDPVQARAIFLRMHEYLMTMALPLLVGLVFIAEDFVHLVLGNRWEPIVLPVQLFALINIVRLSGMIMIPVLQGLGYPGMVMRYSGWCLVLMPVAFFAGAREGINGIMAAWILGYPLVYLHLARELLRVMDITWRQYSQSLLTPGVCAFAMTVALSLIYRSDVWLHEPLLRMVAAISLGGVTYLGSFLLVSETRPHDIIQVWKGLRASNGGGP